MHNVDNAVIMAAGTASRFAPLSFELPKALITVKGDILIERQIKQLQEVGIKDIYIVTGYKAEMFSYLKEKFGVHLVYNPDYLTRNNHSSVYAVKEILGNTYICSADNYFPKNPFEKEVSDCYYAAVYSEGPTKEWCMDYDQNGRITNVEFSGEKAWYMLGHAFFDRKFSEKFKEILEKEYSLPETKDLFWENIFINHINELDMKIRKYDEGIIFEFDTLDELRTFDDSYISNTRSKILKEIVKELNCSESEIIDVTVFKNGTNVAAGFTFNYNGARYSYSYSDSKLKRS